MGQKSGVSPYIQTDLRRYEDWTKTDLLTQSPEIFECQTKTLIDDQVVWKIGKLEVVNSKKRLGRTTTFFLRLVSLMFATFVFVCVGGVMPSKYQNWNIHYLYQENFHAATVGVSSWMILKINPQTKGKIQ